MEVPVGPQTNREAHTIERLTQQSLDSLTPEERLRVCSAVCFYMVLEAEMGHTDGEMEDVTDFLAAMGLDSEDGTSPVRIENGDISRPALSRAIRERYPDFGVASWQYREPGQVAEDDIEGMIAAGYIETEDEIDLFTDVGQVTDLKGIIGLGFTPIVTVAPGFAENRQRHAVVVDGWSDGKVHIVDPNARNDADIFSEEDFLAGIAEGSAVTVIFPKAA